MTRARNFSWFVLSPPIEALGKLGQFFSIDFGVFEQAHHQFLTSTLQTCVRYVADDCPSALSSVTLAE